VPSYSLLFLTCLAQCEHEAAETSGQGTVWAEPPPRPPLWLQRKLALWAQKASLTHGHMAVGSAMGLAPAVTPASILL
jgi:hypothetical protein